MSDERDAQAEEFYPRDAVVRARAAMDEMIQLHGQLQAELMWVQLTVFEASRGTHPLHGESVFAALRNDAKDIRKAAGELARLYERLADEWEAIWTKGSGQ